MTDNNTPTGMLPEVQALLNELQYIKHPIAHTALKQFSLQQNKELIEENEKLKLYYTQSNDKDEWARMQSDKLQSLQDKCEQLERELKDKNALVEEQNNLLTQSEEKVNILRNGLMITKEWLNPYPISDVESAILSIDKLLTATEGEG